MDYAAKEQEANSRILAAVQFLAEVNKLQAPPELASVSGSQQERRVKRLLAVAGFLELLALESIQTGLAAKFAAYGYTSLADLRKASLDDLQVVEGVGKKSAEAVHKALTGDTSNQLEVSPFTEPFDDPLAPLDDEPSVDAMLDEMINE